MDQIFTERDVAGAFGGPVTYLGTGSFGETWRVGDHAVKIIHQESGRGPREIEGLRRVRHPNVVGFLENDEITVAGRIREVLHFEFIPGGDVDQALHRGRLLPVAELTAFLKGILRGVAALHSARILHRDLKPGNVALRDGQWSAPVILDLGLARVLDMDSITAYPALMGTLPYMAPEQIAGRRVRKAADLFAAGVLTRQVVTGHHPFYPPGVDVPDVGALLRRIDAGPVPLPTEVPIHLRNLLDDMVSPAEHKRGSTRSCLRNLEEKQ